MKNIEQYVLENKLEDVPSLQVKKPYTKPMQKDYPKYDEFYCTCNHDKSKISGLRRRTFKVKGQQYILDEPNISGVTAGLNVRSSTGLIAVTTTGGVIPTFNWLDVKVPVGTIVGKTNGKESWSVLYGSYIEFKSSIKLGKYKAGTTLAILNNGGNSKYKITLEAPNTTGGNPNYPMTFNTINSEVKRFQRFLFNCGHNTGGIDGHWGSKTEASRVKMGLPSKINSKSELDQIIAQGCRSSTGGTGTGNTGGNDPIIIDDPVLDTPTQSKDNTLLYGALAIGGIMLLKQRKSKKRRRRR